MWIKMVARIMAIGPGEWNGRERERSNDVHLVILGPVRRLPLPVPPSSSHTTDKGLC